MQADEFTCRYECIENDLLGSLQLGTHNIAPYKSKGIERASELLVGWSTKTNAAKETQPSYSVKIGNFTSIFSGFYDNYVCRSRSFWSFAYVY